MTSEIGSPGSVNSLLVTSMRRVIELYYLTEPETRIALPPFVPDKDANPEAFSQISKRRLRFAMQQGILNGLEPIAPGTQETPFHETARRLKNLFVRASEGIHYFLTSVETRRAEEEEALNARLQQETLPGWKRKRARVYTLNDREDERMRIRLNASVENTSVPSSNAQGSLTLSEDRDEDPIYLLVQLDRTLSYPASSDGVHIQAAIVVGNTTMDDPTVCYAKYYLYNVSRWSQTHRIVSVYDLVMHYMVDYYIDHLVLPSIIARVLRFDGVDLDTLNAIMTRPMAQLVEYEAQLVTTIDHARTMQYSEYKSYMLANMYTALLNNYDRMTKVFLVYSLEWLLFKNDTSQAQPIFGTEWDRWSHLLYANPARKLGAVRMLDDWMDGLSEVDLDNGAATLAVFLVDNIPARCA